MDEKLEIQQQSIQAQLGKSIATTEMLSKQVNSIQVSLETLTQTMNAFMFRMSDTTTPPGAQPQQQAYGPVQTFGTPTHGGMQPPPPAYGAGHTVTPGQGQFSTPSRPANTQQSSLQAASMQLMNPGYNHKFMAPMYNPMADPNQTQQYSQQHLAGSNSTNNMEMTPTRGAV
jgi:hypothetical protein